MSATPVAATAGAGDAVHLEVRDLRVHYDGIKAVHGVSFSVRQGEVLTLIGANGAGKTSILRAISGLVPYEGTITFAGRDLRGVPAHRIVGLGMAHVPEGRGIFGNLTVRENLRLATWQRRDRGAIEEDREQQLVIKTTQDRVAAIEARFQELHPYELPEFVVLSAEASTAYLGWLRDSVAVK